LKKRYVELQVTAADPHRYYINHTLDDPYHWASVLVDSGGIAVFNGEFYSTQHTLTAEQMTQIESGFTHIFLDGRETENE